MNSTARGVVVASFFAMFGGLMSSARTIAYWPLNYNTKDGTVDLRSVAGPYTLTAPNGIQRSTANFSSARCGVPANVDAADCVDYADGDGYGAVVSKGYLTTTGLDACLDVLSSWTIEGWFKLDDVPSSGAFCSFFTTREPEQGWLLKLQERSGALSWELFAHGCVNDNSVFAANINPAELVSSWHHLALTHNRTESGIDGKGVWHLYVDGVESPNAITNHQAIFKAINNCDTFSIGSRKSMSGFLPTFKTDSIRICDEALTPERFVNASDATPRLAAGETLGYWRLNSSADLDNLAISRYYLLGMGHSARTECVSDRAYESIPNGSSGLPNSDGSFVSDSACSTFSVSDAGADLDFDKHFTLEGWYKCIPTGVIGYVFGTRIRDFGFTLWYTTDGNLRLYARAQDDGTKTRIPVNDVEFQVPNAIRPLAWRWAHIALTHNPDGGNGYGVWTVYVDGVSIGEVTGTVESVATSAMRDLYIGGREKVNNPIGRIDTVRLAKRVLQPSEFLCAVGGTSPAASDIGGIWLFNHKGPYLDLSDATGHYASSNLKNPCLFTSQDKAVEEVPNPPQDVVANGGTDSGCLEFPESSASDMPNGLVVKGGICEELKLTKDFTLEGWLRFDRPLSEGDWKIIWSAGDEQTAPRWWLIVRRKNGIDHYMIYCQLASGNPIEDNTTFPSDPEVVYNIWRHHALVYRVSSQSFELFIDGVSKGCVALKAGLLPSSGMPFTSAHNLNIGGRSTSVAQNFPGAMDTFRITKRALTSLEFLNAKSSGAVKAVATKGYWKLDSDGETVSGLDSSVPGVWNGLLGASLVGSTDCFRKKVPNPDQSPDFIGERARNVGSVRVNGVNGLSGAGLRRRVSIENAFTLEGWIRWDGTGGFPQTLATTECANDYTQPCWKLSLVAENKFGVVFRDANGREFIEAEFTSPSALAGAWTHVAMTYSPCLDNDGQCALFVNLEKAGTASAFFSPVHDTAMRVYSLLLGCNDANADRTFHGLMDTWRLSDGILDKKDLMAVADGLMIILR